MRASEQVRWRGRTCSPAETDHAHPTTTFDKIFAFQPNILGALIILIIGLIIAKIAKAIVTKSLQKLDLDQKLEESDAHSYVEKVMPGALRPARLPRPRCQRWSW